jgi:hypothetical protein
MHITAAVMKWITPRPALTWGQALNTARKVYVPQMRYGQPRPKMAEKPGQGRRDIGPQIANLSHTAVEPQPKKPARRPAAANNGCPTRIGP